MALKCATQNPALASSFFVFLNSSNKILSPFSFSDKVAFFRGAFKLNNYNTMCIHTHTLISLHADKQWQITINDSKYWWVVTFTRREGRWRGGGIQIARAVVGSVAVSLTKVGPTEGRTEVAQHAGVGTAGLRGLGMHEKWEDGDDRQATTTTATSPMSMHQWEWFRDGRGIRRRSASNVHF